MSKAFDVEPYELVSASPDGKNIRYKKRNISFFGSQIPDFVNPDVDGVSKMMAEFYNEVLFPNYDDLDDFGSLLEKGGKSAFTRQLDLEIPTRVKVMELGCGTGQLSLFLSRFDRDIYGVDLSKGSLKLGEKFKLTHSRNKVKFVRADVFDLPFKEGYFDYIVSNGVLHHTKDAKQAFFALHKHLKPGGVIIIGLYHKYGRVLTKIKQRLAPILGKNIRYLDRTLRSMPSEAKKYAWERDQFFNPKESTHTIKETINWINELDMEFIKSMPLNYGANNNLLSSDVISGQEKPSAALHLQEMAFAINPTQILEGGFFVISARKKSHDNKKGTT